MARRRIHLEQLLGREVHDVRGEPAGRIEEVVARRDGSACFVQAYVLGREGLAHRLSISGVSSLFVGFLGARRHAPPGHHVPWAQMDLADPERPRLRCTVKDLEAMQPPKEPPR